VASSDPAVLDTSTCGERKGDSVSLLSNEAALRFGLAVAESSLGDRKDDTQVALCRRLREVESRAATKFPKRRGDTVSPLSSGGAARDEP